MKKTIERIIARFWNRRAARLRHAIIARALDLGALVSEGESTRGRVSIDQDRRAEHIAILGKTGSGKSYSIRYVARQDITAGRGFCYFDLHGDATPFLLATIAEKERLLNQDLSQKTIVIEPSDPDFSVGFNPLEGRDDDNRFVQIAE